MISTKKLCSVFIFAFVLCCSFNANGQDANLLEGRWDIEMEFEGKTVPSWLEIRHSGHATFIGRFVFAFGSARPVSEVKIQNNSFTFSIPRQWEPEGGDM